jgi:hypothetical protein
VTDPGIEEEFADVFQAAGLPVEQVFTLAGSVEPSGNDDFGLVGGEGVVGVVELQIDDAHICLTRLGLVVRQLGADPSDVVAERGGLAIQFVS